LQVDNTLSLPSSLPSLYYFLFIIYYFPIWVCVLLDRKEKKLIFLMLSIAVFFKNHVQKVRDVRGKNSAFRLDITFNLPGCLVPCRYLQSIVLSIFCFGVHAMR